nr:pleckstrin homology domain-containing family N member 1 [Pelodiscus sinensis]|eukprot:XP_025042464.1 pleckstrin homology domain-containing family N member 1 [Pelodiscus sinensis]
MEQDSKKKLASLFGIESGHERDITADKILQYIPGRNITDQENQKENLDQRFPSLFKKGRRKTVVRNLGKIIYYSKVKFKFQHCQEVNDCYLELFQSHLYFQSVGSNGLTYQGLLPLKELSVCDTEKAKRAELEQHAFRITGECCLVGCGTMRVKCELAVMWPCFAGSHRGKRASEIGFEPRRVLSLL